MKRNRIIGIGILILLLHGLVWGADFTLPGDQSGIDLVTNGPNLGLDEGDWWSNASPQAGNQAHVYELYVPYLVRPDFELVLELYDPESYGQHDDQTRDDWDSTTFTLIAPNQMTVITEQKFEPSPETSGSWVPFVSIQVVEYGWGIYSLFVSTSDDDVNRYRIRLVESDPDGIPNDGDELSIAQVQGCFSLQETGCAPVWFYTPPSKQIRLMNFDMDAENDNSARITYTDPAETLLTGTLSASGLWNQSESQEFPPPGGDLISQPHPGWWQADLCMEGGNTTLFYTGSPLFFDEKPKAPHLVAEKESDWIPGNGYIDYLYTMTISNEGDAPALFVTIRDTLPPNTEYLQPTAINYINVNDQYDILSWNFEVIQPGMSHSIVLSSRIWDDSANQPPDQMGVRYEDTRFNTYRLKVKKQRPSLFNGVGQFVWMDVNMDGQKNAGEPGLADVRVVLENAENDAYTTETNDQGIYQFSNITPGSYRLTIDESTLPDGYVLTTNNLPLDLEVQSDTWFFSANFGFNNVAFPIELSSFTANYIAGAVQLEWVTESETDNLGFYIYRSLSPNGPFEKCSETLIPGAGNSSSRNAYQFTDDTIVRGKTYYYRLADVSHSGELHMSETRSVKTHAPNQYVLEQNYPNPFNPSTTIEFNAAESGMAQLVIYNVLGQTVKSLVDNYVEAGQHKFTWDGLNENGRPVPSGYYLYKLTINGYTETKKMTLLK